MMCLERLVGEQASVKARYCADLLQDIPSIELRELVIDLLKKHEGETIDLSKLWWKTYQDEIFMYKGACDILRERHGKEYMFKLTGYRLPRTFCEKFKYFFKRLLKYEY